MTQTAERKDKFKWVVPLSVDNVWLFKRAGSNINVSKLDEAKAYKVGVYRDDRAEHFLKKQGGFNLEVVNKNELNYKKLGADRIDLWAASPDTHLKLSKKYPDIKVEKVVKLFEYKMGIGCHKSTSNEIIQKLQAALDIMNKDGSAEAIRKKFRTNFFK